MTILLIDSNDYLLKRLKGLKLDFEFKSYYKNVKDETIFDIAENIAEKFKNIDAYIINIEAEYSGAGRNDYKGIKLLFWLRIKYFIGKPIIITGFRSLTSMLKKFPHYTILNAKGIYFTDILSDFSVINKVKKEVLTEKDIREHYLQHAKNSFIIENARHDAANWWALKTLTDIHNLVTNNISENSYPKFVKSQLKELNNELAVFLYPISENRVADIIEDLITKQTERYDVIEKLKIKTQSYIERININNELIKKATDDIVENKKRIKRFEKLKINTSPLQKQIVKLNNNIEIWDSENKEINKKNNEIPLKTEIKIPEKYKKSIDVSVKKANILHIDDKAKEGWSMLFKNIFSTYIETVEIENVAFEKIRNYFDLTNAVKEKLNSNKFNIIILDLRLFSSDKNVESPTELTGVKILELIKNEYPGIPVIITTASNKIFVYKTCMSKGADVYWVKEGIDDKLSEDESAKSYERIKDIVINLISDEYALLTKMRKQLVAISDKNNVFWWEDYKWDNNNIQGNLNGKYFKIKNKQVDKKEVIATYRKGLELCTVFLRQKFFTFDTKNYEDENFYIPPIFNIFGKILELIHKQKQISTGVVLRYRGDSVGLKLYNKRNRFSHYNKHNPTINEFVNFFEMFINYLKDKPTIDKELKEKTLKKHKKNYK